MPKVFPSLILSQRLIPKLLLHTLLLRTRHCTFMHAANSNSAFGILIWLPCLLPQEWSMSRFTQSDKGCQVERLIFWQHINRNPPPPAPSRLTYQRMPPIWAMAQLCRCDFIEERRPSRNLIKPWPSNPSRANFPPPSTTTSLLASPPPDPDRHLDGVPQRRKCRSTLKCRICRNLPILGVTLDPICWSSR